MPKTDNAGGRQQFINQTIAISLPPIPTGGIFINYKIKMLTNIIAAFLAIAGAQVRFPDACVSS